MATAGYEVTYRDGYTKGRADAERDAFAVLSAIVAAVGGKVIVPHALLVTDRGLIRYDDKESDCWVFETAAPNAPARKLP